MRTGTAKNGRTKDDVTADKSRGGKEGSKNSAKYMTTGTANNGRTKAEITADKSRGGGNGGVASTTMVLHDRNTNPDWYYYSHTHAPMAEKMVELKLFNSERMANDQFLRLKEYAEELEKPFKLMPATKGKQSKDFVPYRGACGKDMPTDLNFWLSTGKVPKGVNVTELKKQKKT